MTTTPSPPKGSGTPGRALWRSITSTYELAEHELALLGQATTVADRISALDEIVNAEGAMVDDPRRGMQIAHPALSASRQERVVLARLLSTLRLPDETDHRPQRRGMRGFYGPRRVTGSGAAS